MGVGVPLAPPDAYPIQRAATDLGILLGPPKAANAPRSGRVAAPAWHAAVDVPTRPALDVQHVVRRARCPDRTRFGQAARRVLSRTLVRVPRHEGHRLPRACLQARP